MVGKRKWLSALLALVSVGAYAQIDSAEAGCAVLDAALGAEGEDGGIAISIEVWSVAVEPWSYEVETSSGAIFIVSSDGTVLEQVRDAQSRSRKQLERSATARAVLAGEIPGLCDLFREHYRTAPGSILIEAELEYEHGSYEADLEYRNAPDAQAIREREWEW